MADEPFVDAHIHFWDKSAIGLEWAWLEPGYQFRKWTSHPSIDAPRYSTPEFLAEAAGTGLVGAVHVHAADPIRPVGRDGVVAVGRSRDRLAARASSVPVTLRPPTPPT